METRTEIAATTKSKRQAPRRAGEHLPGKRSKAVAAWLSHIEANPDDDEGALRAQTDAALGAGASKRGFSAIPSACGGGKWVYSYGNGASMVFWSSKAEVKKSAEWRSTYFE